MPGPTPTVCIVDQDRTVRESLAALSAAAGWRPECYASAEDFDSRPHCGGPSCLLLDNSFPGTDGFSLLARRSAGGLDLPVIIITGQGDVPMAVRAMKAGAVALLTKPLDPGAVLDAIGEALERSQELIWRGTQVRELRERYDSLSVREREVMLLVVAGLLNKQVGARLGIREITVKAHRGRVMRKMRADSLADLVRYAVSLQLSSERTPVVPRPTGFPRPYAGPVHAVLAHAGGEPSPAMWHAPAR